MQNQLRTLALGILVCLTNISAAQEADVAWLSKVNAPPQAVPMPKRALTPLLPAEVLKSDNAKAAWLKEREALREKWLAFLGPMPKRPENNSLEVLKTENFDWGKRQKVRYENEPDQFIEAYLLIPTPKQAGSKQLGANKPSKSAGLVALHPTTNATIEEIAGVQGAASQHLGLDLAKEGFVVFCPKNFLWQEAKDLQTAVKQFHARRPETRGMHKMLYDAQRATDILASLPEVDPQRIGAVGHSLGAKETLYLMAFDKRIRAGVFSEGGIALDSTNWEAPWYLGKAAREDSFPFDHHQLISLIAPRPFLVLAGETGAGAADGDRSWPCIAAAQPIYRLYGEPVRVGLFNHHQGHAIPAEAHKRLVEWLRVYTAAE